MSNRVTDHRMIWLAIGVAAGLCLSYFWPHEPALAVTTDRNSKFAMATCEISSVSAYGGAEGIFVLDFLTGQLTGAILNNKTGTFTYRCSRSIANDFKVDPKAEPHYAIVTGSANLPNKGNANPASGVIYIGELSSGQVICYSFPYRFTNRPTVVPLTKLAWFPFRDPSGD